VSDNQWLIGSKDEHYGTVEMCRTIEGEPYRFFIDENGDIAMIPLDALQQMDDN
jgi:hypothetical protein